MQLRSWPSSNQIGAENQNLQLAGLTSSRHITWIFFFACEKKKKSWQESTMSACFIFHLTEHVFVLFDRASFSSFQQSAGVRVETVSAPGPTCAPVPTARSPHPADPSQVVKQNQLFPGNSTPWILTFNPSDGSYSVVCIHMDNLTCS